MNLTGNNDCVLDTNIIIDLFKGNIQVVNKLSLLDHIYVSNIAIGELYFGAYASSNPNKHIQQIQDLLIQCSVICCDEETSVVYGQSKTMLKKKGSLFPKMIFGLLL